MMTQGVMTQAAGVFSGRAKSTVTGVGPNRNGFDLILSNSIRTERNQSGRDPVKGSISGSSKASESRKFGKGIGENRKASGENAGKDREGLTEEVDKENKASGTDRITETTNPRIEKTRAAEEGKAETEPAKDKEQAEQILGMLEAIRETVIQILGLTPEEFDRRMEALGLGITNLTDPEALKQMVLADRTETDLMAFLTDENLSDTLNRLTEAVENIQRNSGLDLTEEEIGQLLDSLCVGEENETVNNEILEETFRNPDGPVKVAPESRKAEVGETQENTTPKASDNSADPADRSDQTVELTDAEKDQSREKPDLGRQKASAPEADKQIENFVEHLAANVTKTYEELTGDMVRSHELREIASQIIEKVRVLIKPGQTTMELQLNPEHLGKVSLTVQEKNGAMTAQFVVQNDLAKEAIEGQMFTLRETLDQQGIKVESIEVLVSGYSFEQSSQSDAEGQMADSRGHRGPKLTLEEAAAMKDLPEEQAATIDASGIRGNTVDYTA